MVEMIRLDIRISNNLACKTRQLAVQYFGDDSDASLAQVVEVAFRMRYLWSHSVTRGQQDTDEAVSTWEFPELTVNQENGGSIRNWLFRR